jgi:alpha-beta hydrolase superfamily lysophospholipase
MARRSVTFRLVRGLIATLAAAYLLTVSALWYWQASFIFQPSPVVDTTPSDLGVKFEKVTLPIGSGQVAGWWVPSQAPHAATLLYSHGNANNVGANVQEVVRFQKAGLNVFIYDYRGYGESTGGPPREKLAYEDAERAWTYLVSERRIAPATIVIYGHSLGGVVAIDLASKHADAGALITESTLTSIADLADGMGVGRFLPVRLILTERFDALSRIRAVHVPTLILQGQEDTQHLAMGQRLYDAANDPKQRAVIPGGGHDHSAEVNPTAYFAALNGFLSQHLVFPLLPKP